MQIMRGVHENMLEVPYMDQDLRRTAAMCDWMCDYDVCNTKIFQKQHFSLMPQLPVSTLAASNLCQSAHPCMHAKYLLYYDDSVVLCPAALGIGNRLHTGKSVCSTFEGATALAQDRHISDQARQRHSRHSHGLGGVSAGPCSHVLPHHRRPRNHPCARRSARPPAGRAGRPAARPPQEPCRR